MESTPTSILVVAGLIEDETGRMLLQQCPAHKRHAGKWEFPGGKVENGETARVALCRELAEELALEIDPGALEPAGFAEEPASEGRPALVMLLYRCRAWGGRPKALENQEFGWFGGAEAARLDLPDMDRALLTNLLRG